MTCVPVVSHEPRTSRDQRPWVARCCGEEARYERRGTAVTFHVDQAGASR